jgi:hypothetical protein
MEISYETWFRRSKTISVVGILVLGCGAMGFIVWRTLKEKAVLSCVSSVHQGIQNLDLTEKDLHDLTSEWRFLGEAQSARIIAAASKIHRFDCSNGRSNGPFDFWGKPLQVAVRKKPDEQLEFRVWSKGRDGISGTSDDLVSPYGASAVIAK